MKPNNSSYRIKVITYSLVVVTPCMPKVTFNSFIITSPNINL